MCCHTLHVAGLPACLPHAARAVVASVFATCGTYSGCQRVRHTRHVPVSAHVSATRMVLCTYRVRRSKRASTSVLVGCQCVCHTRHVAVAPPSVPDDCQCVCHTRHVAVATTAVLVGCQRVCHTRHVAAPSPSVHRALLHQSRGVNTQQGSPLLWKNNC